MSRLRSDLDTATFSKRSEESVVDWLYYCIVKQVRDISWQSHSMMRLRRKSHNCPARVNASIHLSKQMCHSYSVNAQFLVPMRLGDTPVLIPNTMVKTQAADGTALETKWESRWVPELLGV